jgi:hypothetical protein
LEVVGVALCHHLESLPLPYRIFIEFFLHYFLLCNFFLFFFLARHYTFNMQGRWCQEKFSIDFYFYWIRKNSLNYRFFFLIFFFSLAEKF